MQPAWNWSHTVNWLDRQCYNWRIAHHITYNCWGHKTIANSAPPSAVTSAQVKNLPDLQTASGVSLRAQAAKDAASPSKLTHVWMATWQFSEGVGPFQKDFFWKVHENLRMFYDFHYVWVQARYRGFGPGYQQCIIDYANATTLDPESCYHYTIYGTPPAHGLQEGFYFKQYAVIKTIPLQVTHHISCNVWPSGHVTCGGI